MSTDKANVISCKQVDLFDDLQGLLEKQIEMARKSNFHGVETLVEQANSIVAEIGRTKAFEQVEFNDRRKSLVELYERLALTVAAKKYLLGKQLQQVSEGRKTIQTYQNSIKYR